jgi:hypothetical protein
MRFSILLLVLIATLGGCQNALLLPGSAPDEPAYINGTIVSRDDRFENQRSALVVAEPTNPEDRRRAHVLLEGSPTIRWRDRRAASLADLRSGRVVSVWVTGPELRSYPPIVSAHTIIIER